MSYVRLVRRDGLPVDEHGRVAVRPKRHFKMTRKKLWVMGLGLIVTVVVLEGGVALLFVARGEVVGGVLIIVGWLREFGAEVIAHLFEHGAKEMREMAEKL